MKKVAWVGSLIVLLNFVLTLIVYPRLPETIANHWNAQGVVDGFIDKGFGVYTLPIIMLVVFILLISVPKLDPLKKNIEKFLKYYNMFVIVFLLFFTSLNIQILLWNLGTKISPLLLFPIGFSVLCYFIGLMTEHAEQNLFIGIRTPWTLASKSVWNKTHKLAGKLYKSAAVLSFVGVFFQTYAIFFVLIPIISVSAVLVVYSYLEFRKEQKKE